MPYKIKPFVVSIAILVSFAGWSGLNAVLRSTPAPTIERAKGEKNMPNKIYKSEEEWKRILTPEEFRILRKGGTECAFAGKYSNHFEPGTYVCAACGTPLFASDSKYDHRTGWPSFTRPISEANLEFHEDRSLPMTRTEVRCAVCGSHLGHVFNDDPAPAFEHYCINSAALNFIPAEKKPAEPASPAESGKASGAANTAFTAPKTETAVFAAGCFWGVEYKFAKVKGVLSTEVGYSGGTTKNPTYEQVSTKSTGHAESVRVTFDPAQTSFEDLVRFFFTIHDSTQVNRQGPDIGTQYRSVIFYRDENQKETARRIIDELNASGRFKMPIATSLVPAAEFTRAEEYHQKYYEKNKKGACIF